jgi:hypothetical protein
MHCYRRLNHDARSKGKKFTSKVTTIQPPRIPWKTCNVIFLNSFMDICIKEKAKTSWLGIGIVCQSGATSLSADSCFSELALYKIQLSMLEFHGKLVMSFF